MRLARVLGGVGRLLIWAGVVILLFVGYQLWGTNLAEARAQDGLEDDFRALLDGTGDGDDDAPTTTTTAPVEATTTTTTSADDAPSDTAATDDAAAAQLAAASGGDPIARIEIPAIGVDKIVVEGVSRSDLQKGPGHYPEAPFPGQPGNAAIAGHRTTYGAPFNRVDELEPGDEILVTTIQGEFTYVVRGQQIVSPSEVSVVQDQGDDRLTLTSCHPKLSARQRIVISAELEDPPAPVVERATRRVDQSVDPAGPTALDGEERGPVAPVVAWGLVALAVWVCFWLLSRRWRRWPSYALGVVPFGVALFVWFGALAELLPTNY